MFLIPRVKDSIVDRVKVKDRIKQRVSLKDRVPVKASLKVKIRIRLAFRLGFQVKLSPLSAIHFIAVGIGLGAWVEVRLRIDSRLS